MPVPWDTFVPFGIMFAVSVALGETMELTHRLFSNGKLPRRLLDRWELQLIKRDEQLTGNRFVQHDPTASAEQARRA